MHKPILRDRNGQIVKGSGRPPGAGPKMGVSYADRIREIRAYAKSKRADPIEIMIDEIADLMAHARHTRIIKQRREFRQMAVAVATKLAPYVHPALKQVEVYDVNPSDHFHLHVHGKPAAEVIAQLSGRELEVLEGVYTKLAELPSPPPQAERLSVEPAPKTPSKPPNSAKSD